MNELKINAIFTFEKADQFITNYVLDIDVCKKVFFKKGTEKEVQFIANLISQELEVHEILDLAKISLCFGYEDAAIDKSNTMKNVLKRMGKYYFNDQKDHIEDYIKNVSLVYRQEIDKKAMRKKLKAMLN
jgi:predicted hydrocarbon binding protein